MTNSSPELTATRISWAGMMVTIVVFFCVGNRHFFSSTEPVSPEPTLIEGLQNPIGIGALAVVVALLVASFLLPGVLKKSILAAAPEAEKLPNPNAMRPQPTKPGPNANIDPQRIMPEMIGLAVNESAAAAGFIAGIVILQNHAFGNLLMGIAALCMLARFPRGTTPGKAGSSGANPMVRQG